MDKDTYKIPEKEQPSIKDYLMIGVMAIVAIAVVLLVPGHDPANPRRGDQQ
jgi:hypothetical protein